MTDQGGYGDGEMEMEMERQYGADKEKAEKNEQMMVAMQQHNETQHHE